MDYEQMSVQELRAECQARGLGTARSKAELVKKLTDNDSTASRRRDDVVEVAVPVTPETTPVLFNAAAAPTPPRSFRKTFTAEPGGPDEETHLAYRQATIQAAAEAGLTPRGDARLADSRGGVWVYEVSVRQGPRS